MATSNNNKQSKNILQSMSSWAKREYIIKRYQTKFKLGHLSPNTKEYLQYVDAVWQQKKLKEKYLSFCKVYDGALKPTELEAARGVEKKHEQILFALKSLRPLQLIPDGEFDAAVEKRLQKVLETEKEKLRQEMEQRLQERTAFLATEWQKKIQEERQELQAQKHALYQKVLPFSNIGDLPNNNSTLPQEAFISKDFQRLAALEQQKKQQELEKLEQDLLHQQREQSLEGKKQELHSQKIELHGLRQQVDIESQKLSLQSQQIEAAKKLLLLEVQEKEMAIEKRLLELTKVAANIQQERADIEIQKKHIELINMLSDYDMKTREFDLAVTQKLLDIKGQNLDRRFQELDFATQQQQSKLEIEHKLLELRDQEFGTKAKETLLEIEKTRHDVENKTEKLQLKEKGVELLFQEKNIHVQNAYNDLARKENDLTLAKMEMVEQRHQLMNRLAIAEHKALNAQNQTRYLQSGDKGNIWTTLAFLWNQHRRG